MNTSKPIRTMLHETPLDRERELIVLKRWATANMTMILHWHPPASPTDATMFDGTMIEVEAKTRYNVIDQYPDYTIDVAKLDTALDVAPTLHLVVQWIDIMGHTIVTRDMVSGLNISRQTMRKPRDQWDIGDPVYHVPLDAFDMLGFAGWGSKG